MSVSQLANTIISPLLDWYDQNKADLPWRDTDAYCVWLSEIMLQQTQIDTVIPYYKRFLALFPTINHLANAPLDAVLKMWEGLGYYSRARNLHKAAQMVSKEFQGVFPSDITKLQLLAGVGRYTAGAIASISFDISTPVLDGNVIRVFSRWFDLEDDVTQTKVKNRLWEIAEELVPEKRAGDYNQALMELGQKICRPKNPHCEACPVQKFCKAYANGTQAKRPVKKKRAPIPHYDVAAGIIRDENGRLLIAQRPMNGLLGGLWEFAGGKQEKGETLPECLKRELHEEMAIEVEVGVLFVTVKHAFTHFKITLHAYECRYLGAMDDYDEPQTLECENWAWVTENELEKYSFGKADRVVIQAILERKDMLL